MIEPVLEVAAGRLERCIEYRAVDVELAAVVAAAYAVLLDASVLQRGTTMAAMPMQDTYLARLVTECDKIFTQNSDRLRQIAKLF